VFRVQAVSHASAASRWCLVAEPAHWSEWAPHIRGAVGLGSPEVELGRRGVALIAWVAPVPVHITAKDPGRAWEWTTGPVRVRHIVEPLGTGCIVRMELEAPAPIEALLAATYGPLIKLVVRRLTQVAMD
jgi:hypothetical protein